MNPQQHQQQQPMQVQQPPIQSIPQQVPIAAQQQPQASITQQQQQIRRPGQPPIHQYHSQTQLNRNNGLKKYEIQRPDRKDLGPGLGPPDFYPLDENAEEDTLTQAFILGGFCEIIKHDEFKSSSAIFKNLDFPKAKEQLLQSIYEVEWKKNSTQKTQQNLPTMNKNANKRAVPEQKAWSASHRESWVLKLAGNEPLQKLASSVPHGYKGETLLKMFLDNQVPLVRATWYTKIVYGNMPKHKTVEPSNDWTKTIVQSLFALIRNTTIESNTKKPLQQQQPNAVTNSYTGILYIERLIKWNFTEGLLNRDLFLSMLIDHLNETDRPEEAVLISSLLLQYSDTLILSTYHSLKFLTKAYEKLIKITASPQHLSVSSSSKHHQPQQPIQPVQPITQATQLNLQMSPPNQRIYSMLSIIAKQISMNLPDTFMSFKNFKELLYLIYPQIIINKIEYNQLMFQNNLKFTVSPEFKWISKYYSEINKIQQQQQQQQSQNKNQFPNNILNQRYKGLNYSDLIKSLDKFYIGYDLRLLYQEIFNDNHISLEDDKEKILLICEWACTSSRNYPFTFLSACSLLKIYERNLLIKFNNLNHPLQNILVQFLETFKPNSIELNKIWFFFSELIRNEIFSQNSYARYIISRGILEETDYLSSKNYNGINQHTDNSSNNKNNQYHKIYLREFPIFNKNDFPSFEIHQQRNQRRTILFPNASKSQEEINNMEQVRNSIKSFVLDIYNLDFNNTLDKILIKLRSLSYYSQISLTEWLSLCIRLNFNNNNLNNNELSNNINLTKGFRRFSFPITKPYIEKIFLLMESISNYHSILQCLLVFWNHWNLAKDLQSFIFYTTYRLELSFITSDQFITLLDTIYKKVVKSSTKGDDDDFKNRDGDEMEDDADEQSDQEDDDGEDEDNDEDDDQKMKETQESMAIDSEGNNNNNICGKTYVESYLYHIIKKYQSIKSVSTWLKRSNINCKFKKDFNNINNINNNIDKNEINNDCKEIINKALNNNIEQQEKEQETIEEQLKWLDDQLNSNDNINSYLNELKVKYTDSLQQYHKELYLELLNTILNFNLNENNFLLFIKQQMVLSQIICQFSIVIPFSITNEKELFLNELKNYLQVNLDNGSIGNEDDKGFLKIIVFLISLVLNQYCDIYSIVVYSILPLLQSNQVVESNANVLFLIRAVQILLCNDITYLSSMVLCDSQGDNNKIKASIDHLSIRLKMMNKSKVSTYLEIFQTFCKLYNHYEPLSNPSNSSTHLKTFQNICSILTDPDSKFIFLSENSIEKIKELNLNPIETRYLFYLILGNVRHQQQEEEEMKQEQQDSRIIIEYEPLKLENCLNYSFKVIDSTLTNSSNCYWNIYLSYIGLKLLLDEWKTLPLLTMIQSPSTTTTATTTNTNSSTPMSTTPPVKSPNQSPLLQSTDLLNSNNNSKANGNTTPTNNIITSPSNNCETFSPESIITQFILLHFEENRGWERVFIYEDIFLLFPQVRNELIKITVSILESQYQESSFDQPLVNLPLINHIKQNLPINNLLKQQPQKYSYILNRPQSNTTSDSSDELKRLDNLMFQESFTDIIIHILSTFEDSSNIVSCFILSIFKQLSLFFQFSKPFDVINLEHSLSETIIQSIVVRITFLITQIKITKSIVKSSNQKLEEVSILLLNLLSKFIIQSEDEFNLFDPILTILDLLISDKFEQPTPLPPPQQQQQNDQKNSIKKKLHELYQKIKSNFPLTLQNKLEKQLSFLTSNPSPPPFTIIHPACLIACNVSSTSSSANLNTFTPPLGSAQPSTPPLSSTQPVQSIQTPQLVSNIQDLKSTFTQMDPWTLLEDYSETPLSPSIYGGIKIERKELTYIKSTFPSKNSGGSKRTN
ncbi:hypothetical protein DICPUDRAFT_78016 [Dictyostelium purpureum]|uniref:Mediator complex subunit Med12 domain-containing protein n=1 Tax=Dictyostelium purpureum TaxID=5786 RepID=F0ZIB5_DICPU|nr:uncharacterized protein DICPUDRAFT_78016 [Dictyostelium purpureum]EGC36329.1 hypothetical protein DICPUDRAFT_78016 [Dictyostelium purpureum]|eukprot:XP_003287144.1 hypothetical protein DICPUDRAFT_78016 [Dictyostelium purpureum]